MKTTKYAVIAGFALDAALLGGGYYCYHQMRNSPDFRYKIYHQDERFLDVYYRANEKYGDGKARQMDYKLWNIEKIESFEIIDKFGL
ncbi:hypothetical protein JTE90_020652 [Oedothorax gibbosus]|uniref:Uncharacterized protein n=1 Tax=Oedothorax gibbosus TaxID=931172 RepID=A0AAV6USB1_9ARAC|nr:hypothetical protein JTE90_020652 [Oedothorax gibbosus]